MSTLEDLDLKEYKTIETRLYGELTKSCRRYTNDLSLISILGILDIVKDEIRELDKAGRHISRRDLQKDMEKEQLNTIG